MNIKNAYNRLVEIAKAPPGISGAGVLKKLGYIIGFGCVVAIPTILSIVFWCVVSPETDVARFLIIAASVVFLGWIQVILLIFWILFVIGIMKYW